ncbi:replication associated protein [Dipodfec virus UA06Rod_92]|uniref:Replication-associated protein n=1 Tax=Dipodfec virus UA06Rod_92 TaxID=2929253 RepID=A0A976N1Q6_9VIRU|nr:replication associated protein [Dipodfec virus UA06Rod_92]
MLREDNINKKARAYCFTINNYNDEDIRRLDALECQYIIYGKEVAPTTRTEHLQGYVYFKNPRAFNSTKRAIGLNSHIEIARGSPQDNIRYCKKENNWKERGIEPKMGKRTDLEDVYESIKEGKNEKEICDEFPKEYMMYTKGIKEAIQLQKKPKEFFRKEQRKVLWLYGKPGCGKTRWAKTEMMEMGYYVDEVYMWSRGSPDFINGYMNQPAAILDDFRAGDIRFATLLQMLDPWNDCMVNVKGGYEWWRADWIMITCCKSPQEEFHGLNENLDQLLRRVEVRRLDMPEDTDLNEVNELDTMSLTYF